MAEREDHMGNAESGAMTTTARAEVRVLNEQGLHARPAAKLAQEAQKYGCEVFLVAGEERVDAKSVVDILTLAASKGTELVLEVSGEGADKAAHRLAEFFRNRFEDKA
ncbi:HPr family phosphocarrier protein [Oceanidesulfovibrio indonesiensis]|uniref:HPr family phosphocarrier protein n=2 Tax=Oceanidesulfovibrio indonesiensis TaxID=54767 RepID=A0A7M3MDT3_9BACT|nr:HPr family phosphocarrier protein [Oceanidesulfovibrio indonesiensis]